jgi:hypothetical protein
MKRDSPPPEDSSNRKRNSPPGETLTLSRDHVRRHTKLDNAEDQQAESPMEVDALDQVPTVTPTGDKDAVTAMETVTEGALMEESAVQLNLVSPQVGAWSEGSVTMVQGTDQPVCTPAQLSKEDKDPKPMAQPSGSDEEEDSKPAAETTDNEVAKASTDTDERSPKAAPTAVMPLRIEVDGPTYTSLWLKCCPAPHNHSAATSLTWDDIDCKTVFIMRLLAQRMGWNEAEMKIKINDPMVWMCS